MRPKSLVRLIAEPLAIAVALAAVVRAGMHLYAIPSESMTPTLQVGDQILVTRYLGGEPERGHVIVFERDGELLVKRVIAVPGDLIDSRLGRVRVGGYTLPEPYVQTEASSGAIASQVVPSGSYFVLGDNREISLDSRSWGAVRREQIIGRARYVLWSAPQHQLRTEANAATAAEPRRSSVRAARRIFKCIE